MEEQIGNEPEEIIRSLLSIIYHGIVEKPNHNCGIDSPCDCLCEAYCFQEQIIENARKYIMSRVPADGNQDKIAMLKVYDDISKMNVKQWNNLISWIEKCRDDIVNQQKELGKTTFRLYN